MPVPELKRTSSESSSGSSATPETPPLFEHFLVVGVPRTFAETQARSLLEDMQRKAHAEEEAKVLLFFLSMVLP